MQKNATQFDAIVIGSGIGSLTTAALLAKQRKMRVLVVLEQHFTAGGQTHEFKRKGKYAFDVGLHYVGCMGCTSVCVKELGLSRQAGRV